MFRFPGFAKLSVHAAGGNSHHNCFDSSNLFFGDLQFPGNAKIVIHSGVTTKGHGGSEMNEDGLTLTQRSVVLR